MLKTFLKILFSVISWGIEFDNSIIFSETLSSLKKLEIDSLANVLAVAIERCLTFYDASYAYLAEKENLRLVTQDSDLLKKCKAAIPIKEMTRY